jgi:hypothetical protein
MAAVAAAIAAATDANYSERLFAVPEGTTRAHGHNRAPFLMARAPAAPTR